ncbi:hypothetical protein K438DRAFT_1760007 [Mycena galopus ATCC 62051]|nr:hypothetical protein K438DRAFT_1760007 [Mycena galopus ATCC 62051]
MARRWRGVSDLLDLASLERRRGGKRASTPPVSRQPELAEWRRLDAPPRRSMRIAFGSEGLELARFRRRFNAVPVPTQIRKQRVHTAKEMSRTTLCLRESAVKKMSMNPAVPVVVKNKKLPTSASLWMMSAPKAHRHRSQTEWIPYHLSQHTWFSPNFFIPWCTGSAPIFVMCANQISLGDISGKGLPQLRDLCGIGGAGGSGQIGGLGGQGGGPRLEIETVSNLGSVFAIGGTGGNGGTGIDIGGQGGIGGGPVIGVLRSSVTHRRQEGEEEFPRS